MIELSTRQKHFLLTLIILLLNFNIDININKLFKACLHVVYLRSRSIDIIVVWEVLLLLLDFSKGDMNSMSSVMFKH